MCNTSSRTLYHSYITIPQMTIFSLVSVKMIYQQRQIEAYAHEI